MIVTLEFDTKRPAHHAVIKLDGVSQGFFKRFMVNLSPEGVSNFEAVVFDKESKQEKILMELLPKEEAKKEAERKAEGEQK